MRKHLVRVALVTLCLGAGASARQASTGGTITEASIRGHMEFLASDAMNGRGSGTRDEWIAATCIASQLRRWGLEPLGDHDDFVQAVESSRMPELARRGARIVADPHPDQHFFERSDNIVLARKGVVAQTVSSYGLHNDYHQPSDDVAHLDVPHMTESIRSMLKPVLWLANSTFVPAWLPGKRP